MQTRRWIRLDVTWEDSEWLDEMDGATAGCWPRLLCMVKRDGTGGHCKRPSRNVLARRWRVTRDTVTALERAAIEDGALRIEDGDWVVENWDCYQDGDPTAAERKRRQRRKRRQANDLESSHGESRNVTDVPRDTTVTRRVTETVTETDTDTEDDASASSSGSDKPNADHVVEIFDYWKTRSGHTRAKLTDGRRRKIGARLKRYDVSSLKRAIDGALSNRFYKGENDTGQRYDWPETLLKNDEAVERHIAYLEAGGQPNGTSSQVEDVKRMLRTGGSMLQMPTGREAAFGEIAEKHPEAWERSGGAFRRMPFAELIALKAKDYELTRRIEHVLREGAA